MIDKSKDYLLQVSKISILYLPKTAEGDATFGTDSVAIFTSVAKLLTDVVKRSTTIKSPEFMQRAKARFHVWREIWVAQFPAALPQASAKLLALGEFWLVDQVEYCDMDDSGLHQRYVLHCTKSNRKPVA